MWLLYGFMMLTVHDFIQTQHPLIQKVGMWLTMTGSGVSITAASFETITVLNVSATLDEWKVYGIIFGVIFGVIGIVIQIAGTVLTHLYRKQQNKD